MPGMMRYLDTQTGDVVLRLATAVDATTERDGLLVVVYCPDDNEHTIFVREVSEFDARFAPMEATQ